MKRITVCLSFLALGETVHGAADRKTGTIVLDETWVKNLRIETLEV